MTNVFPMSAWLLIACLAAFAPSLANGFWQIGVPRDAEESPAFGPLDDEDVDDRTAQETAPLRAPPEMLSRMFDIHVLGSSRKSTEALVGRLEQVLQARVEDLVRECSLSEPQKQKLRLAGRGDIKRLVDRIRDERKPFEAIEARNAELAVRLNLQAVALPLQESTRAGPFGGGSIFVKVLNSAVSSEKFAIYVATDDVQRSGGKITTLVRSGIAYKDVTMPGGLNDECLARLAMLPNLRSLTAELSYISNAQLVYLSGLTGLEVLDLSRTRIGDEGLSHLGRLTNLNILRLRNTPIGDRGLAHLAALRNLRELQIQGTLVSDEGLAHLKGLAQLELLDLARTRITDAGLVALDLSGLTQLQDLGLSQTKITGAGLALVGQCENLERLNLIGTQTTDSALRELKKLKNLRHLLIDQTPITDDGLAGLAKLSRLETLEFSNTEVSDVGLFRLRPLTRLKYVNAANTRVTDDGVSEFHRALPDVLVHK